jgi:hypothetical protein
MMSDFRTYENVLVSGVKYDFSGNRHENIPRRLYADWAALIVKIARAIQPQFSVPPLPETLEFKTESIHSDDPYRSDPDYYILDYVFFELKAENGDGLNINFENGRQGGGNPVTIETLGISDSVSSRIFKDTKAPLAEIFVRHSAEVTPEIEEIIALHRQSCLANI